MAVPNNDNIRYTVFIKVPFPRGDFEDPPDVRRNARGSYLDGSTYANPEQVELEYVKR